MRNPLLMLTLAPAEVVFKALCFRSIRFFMKRPMWKDSASDMMRSLARLLIKLSEVTLVLCDSKPARLTRSLC